MPSFLCRCLRLLLLFVFVNTGVLFPAQAQTPDTTVAATSALHEVEVAAFESHRPRQQTAGAVEVLTPRDLHRFDQTSLVSALNTRPGVRMEERSPGSYRISIRGSSLRAPYGIRNVKVYWNGLPFTDPNGNTALNLLDAQSMSRIEVLKGPSGSLYGAGVGGAMLLFSPRPAINQRFVQVHGQLGSFGLRRYGVTAANGSENTHTLVQYLGQQSDGWREHTALNRHQVQLSHRTAVSPKRELELHAFYTKLYYELPGGLTAEQFAQNPRQARAVAVKQHSSFSINTAFAGLTQTWRISDSLRNATSVYGSGGFIDHPFITDYERNTQLGAGGRSTFYYHSQLAGKGLRLIGGAEVQQGFTASRVYDNAGGRPDSLRLDDEVLARQGLVFAQAEYRLHSRTLLTLGASLNGLTFDFRRISDAGINPDWQQQRRFEPVLSPRVALVQQLTPDLAFQASVSEGFSPPTEAEIRTSEGSLNLDLKPERGTNLEAGLRGGQNRNFRYDLTAYWLWLREGIVSYTENTSVVLFRNTGAIRQQGIELAVYHDGLLRAASGVLNRLQLFGTYAWQRGEFVHYNTGAENLAGKPLTGLPTHTAALGADAGFRFGLSAQLTAQFTGSLPLNDAATVYAREYWLLSAKITQELSLGKQLQTTWFAGADNLLNQRYSLGNDLNAFGGRYFNPAPARSFYFGLTLRLEN